jgi:hypothetical protein
MPTDAPPTEAPLTQPRRNSGAWVKSLYNFVLDLGPAAGGIAFLCKGVELFGKHVGNFFGELSQMANRLKPAAGGSDGGAE